MTGLTLDPLASIALHAGLSLLFIWAAAHKLADIGSFRAVLLRYDLLPQRWAGVAAALLITTELVAAMGLWIPRMSGAAAIAVAGLLALYTAAILLSVLRGREIDCGCGGAAQHQVSMTLAVRNGVLMAAALAGALPVAPRTLVWIDMVTLGAGLPAIVLLYAAIDHLLAQQALPATQARTGQQRSRPNGEQPEVPGASTAMLITPS